MMNIGPAMPVRTTLETSRLLDFCSEKELTAQTGHDPDEWPLVALKELMDDALDACEEAGVAPDIHVTVDNDGIMVADNGRGIPLSTHVPHPLLQRFRGAYIADPSRFLAKVMIPMLSLTAVQRVTSQKVGIGLVSYFSDRPNTPAIHGLGT
jgi:hypothetical protein